MTNHFDLIVIGAGPGGYVAAIRAAQLGKKVLCIEKRASLGGTCLNVGCIPSKALLDSSELYHDVKTKSSRHGILVGDVQLDLTALMKRKTQVVKGLTDGISYLFKKNGVSSVFGSAMITAPGKVTVTANKGANEGAAGEKSVNEYQAPAILLATGSEVATLPTLPLDHQFIVSSNEAISFPEVPKKLIVIGAGYIGLELGSVWNRLGSQVQVIEFLPRILPLTDLEIAGMVQKSLTKQGFEFHLGTKVVSAKVIGNQVEVKAESAEQGSGKAALTFWGDRVLVAVGRRPNSANLGLETIGVTIDAKSGKIPVNSKFETNVPGIYALGDLIAGPMLAHKASEEGIAFAEMLCGHAGHVSYDTIPSVIYLWPEVASVGLNEEEVKKSGVSYKIGKVPFSASGRARCMDESEGVVKIITNSATDRILGVHIFGPRASDMIAEAVTIMEYHGCAEDLARLTHAHPSLSESVGDAAWMAYTGKAIHF